MDYDSKGSVFSQLMNLINFRKKEVHVLVMGLNNSGKSTIINHFKREGDRSVNITPTVGFHVEKFTVKNVDFTVFDMSGDDRHRPLWENYYKQCQGIIFTIDSSDKLRMVVVKEELAIFLQHKDILGRKIPILFLANKMDLQNSLTTSNIVTDLDLSKIQNKPWYIRATNACSGEGLQTGLEWLIIQMKRDIIPTD